MTEEEKAKIERDLRQRFDDDCEFETAQRELKLEDGSEELEYAKQLWATWETE